MAEFIMRDLVEKHGLADAVEVASAATSAEKLGNPVHRGTARILAMLGIDCSEKRARPNASNPAIVIQNQDSHGIRSLI